MTQPLAYRRRFYLRDARIVAAVASMASISMCSPGIGFFICLSAVSLCLFPRSSPFLRRPIWQSGAAHYSVCVVGCCPPLPPPPPPLPLWGEVWTTPGVACYIVLGMPLRKSCNDGSTFHVDCALYKLNTPSCGPHAPLDRSSADNNPADRRPAARVCLQWCNGWRRWWWLLRQQQPVVLCRRGGLPGRRGVYVGVT